MFLLSWNFYTRACSSAVHIILTALGHLRLLGLRVALTTSGSGLTASIGGIVMTSLQISCLFLAGACSGFCSSDLLSHALPVVTGRFAGGQHVDRADRKCGHSRCGEECLADELHVVHECPLLSSFQIRQSSDTTLLHLHAMVEILVYHHDRLDSIRSFFEQKDHSLSFTSNPGTLLERSS